MACIFTFFACIRAIFVSICSTGLTTFFTGPYASLTSIDALSTCFFAIFIVTFANVILTCGNTGFATIYAFFTFWDTIFVAGFASF
jgi:hypothetical protein